MTTRETELLAANAALKAENESLKLDAERYRWLKNNHPPIGIYSNTDFDGCYYIHEPDGSNRRRHAARKTGMIMLVLGGFLLVFLLFVVYSIFKRG